MTERRRTPLALPEIEPHVCTPEVRHSVVGRQRLFAGPGPTELAAIDARCRAQWFDAGEAVYHVYSHEENLVCGHPDVGTSHSGGCRRTRRGRAYARAPRGSFRESVSKACFLDLF